GTNVPVETAWPTYHMGPAPARQPVDLVDIGPSGRADHPGHCELVIEPAARPSDHHDPLRVPAGCSLHGELEIGGVLLGWMALHLDVVVGFGVPGVQIPDQQVDPPAHVTGQGMPTVGRDHEVRFGDVARNLAGEGVAGCEYEDRVHNDKIVLRAPTRVRPNLQVEVEGRNGLV